VSLRWERVDLKRHILRVEETRTGEPLELPITRQLAAVFVRRHRDGGEAGGTRFWFHGLRNAFITVAERELMLPRSLTRRPVNHARPSDVIEGYAADWTVEQPREPARGIADRIDELMGVAVRESELGSARAA